MRGSGIPGGGGGRMAAAPPPFFRPIFVAFFGRGMGRQILYWTSKNDQIGFKRTLSNSSILQVGGLLSSD